MMDNMIVIISIYNKIIEASVDSSILEEIYYIRIRLKRIENSISVININTIFLKNNLILLFEFY